MIVPARASESRHCCTVPSVTATSMIFHSTGSHKGLNLLVQLWVWTFARRRRVEFGSRPCAAATISQERSTICDSMRGYSFHYLTFSAKANSHRSINMLRNVPTEFLCPITMEIMDYPVLSRHGHNFERSAIVAWIEEGSGVCPMTRLPLTMRDLINNNGLLREIEQWRQENGMSTGRPFDEMQSDGSDIMHRVYGAAIPTLLPVDRGEASDPPSEATADSANTAVSSPTRAPHSVRPKLLPWPLISPSRRQRLSQAQLGPRRNRMMARKPLRAEIVAM
jgi:U-box domain